MKIFYQIIEMMTVLSSIMQKSHWNKKNEYLIILDNFLHFHKNHTVNQFIFVYDKFYNIHRKEMIVNIYCQE